MVRVVSLLASLVVIVSLTASRMDDFHASRAAALAGQQGSVQTGSSRTLTPQPTLAPTATPAPTPTPTPKPTQTPDPTSSDATVDAAIAKIMATHQAIDVSIAALNLETGDRYDYGSHSGMVEGSIVKLDILLTLLRKKGGSSLSNYQRKLVLGMMRHSDNGDADNLFRSVGGNAALRTTNQQIGLTSTKLDSSGQWGLSTTCAADQLMLLKQLVGPGVLTADQRSYALDVMGGVAADQRWGVSAAADAGTTTPLKNGWLGVDLDGGRWLVNSNGIVTVHGQQVLLSILTQHNSGYRKGVDLVESLARVTVPAVAAAG